MSFCLYRSLPAFGDHIKMMEDRDCTEQIVYILDQVKALEAEMLLKIKQQGLEVTPQILVVSFHPDVGLFLRSTRERLGVRVGSTSTESVIHEKQSSEAKARA